jgi:hypothetical protein
VHRLNGGHRVSTVPDLKSMLVSLRAHLLEAGYVVPPHNHKGQEGFEPQTRGLYKSPAHEPQDPPRAIPFTGTNPIDGLFMPDDFAATMLTRAQLEDMDKCARRRGGEPLSSMDRHTAPPSGTTASQDTSSSSQTNYQTPVGNDQQGLQRPAATTAMADYGQHDQHLHGSRRTLDANSRIFQERLKEAVSARDPERERDRRARNLRMELQSLARAHARPQALARRPPLQTTTQMPAQSTTRTLTQSTARTPAQSTTQAATLFRHLNEQDRRLVQAIHQALGFDVIGTHSNAASSSGNGGPAGMDQQTPARSIQTQPSDQPSHTSQDRLNSIPEQRDATDSDQDMEEGM